MGKLLGTAVLYRQSRTVGVPETGVSKKATKVQDSLLLIRHSTPGEFGSIYRIKSNAIDGLSLGDL